MSAAAEIAKRLGDATREGRGWRCRCPVHDGVSLNVADGADGRLLVYCFAGCDAIDVLAALREAGLVEAGDWREGEARRVAPARRARDTRPAPADGSTGLWAPIWRETADPVGSIVETYLNRRGAPLPPRYHEVIRFHPACPFKGRRVPAMVALFRDVLTDEPRGIHRTALLADGSDRDRTLGKAMLGRVGGCAIKLCADDEVACGLGLAEGIETGLALIGRGWHPVWAAGSAGAIARFPVLAGVDELTVFADSDEVGLRAGRDCTTRWVESGRQATIRLPRRAGADWGDVASRAA